MCSRVPALIRLAPDLHERVWGGTRLGEGPHPIGESWVAGPANRIVGGPCAGATLAEVAGGAPADLLGTSVAERYGGRVPVLVKLLDASDWLSLQVHPDDDEAKAMVGPDAFGKTEAWYVLDARPGATVLAGVRPGTTREDLVAAIRAGSIRDLAVTVEVRPGDSLVVPAGLLHAVGPGVFLYELQQASDTTYRIWDWDRRSSPARRLHLDESIAVLRPDPPPPPRSRPAISGTGTAELVRCSQFALELVQVADTPFSDDTRERSFVVLTVVAGALTVRKGEQSVELRRHETVWIAGAAGPFVIEATAGPATLLRASVPPA